ncbi:hypothetical protein H072_1673 [Dactylellina haptotyla CBS 200.50]|uniref:Methyltransferase type 11 domain-containing protein n=1 Tax=Dactylellina haptotyla (strain CBS 200.50) TaxID=1284197 RepID=S8AND4_DACHA|nr:hypothetical protein H072_1673 [Dactylellina haptotyla CBS 200.50]
MSEKTFRNFSKEDGGVYAKYRRDYHPNLYQLIIDYHSAKGGEFDTVLDVGCGPGTAVSNLGQQFAHAIGIDPSEGMISAAKALGGTTSISEPIRFEVAAAEDLGSALEPPIAEGSIDVITSATASHWFDMPKFWHQAAKTLKPGGTVALWTGAHIRCTPPTPNYEAVQAAVDKLRDSIEPYREEGNRINDDLYLHQPRPWTVDPPVPEFDESSFLRYEWGTDEKSFPATEFFKYSPPANMDQLELVMGTASPVIRWREAHPELTGTEQDICKIMRREVEEALWAAGVEKGKEQLFGGVNATLMLFTKKK